MLLVVTVFGLPVLAFALLLAACVYVTVTRTPIANPYGRPIGVELADVLSCALLLVLLFILADVLYFTLSRYVGRAEAAKGSKKD